MTRWLQRQEAMDFRTGYLRWLNILIESEENPDFLELEEPDVANDGGEAEYHQEAGNMDAILAELKTEVAPSSSFTYNVAKKSPFPNTSLPHIISAYGATEFLPALQSFLDKHMPCSLKPNQFDCFDIYNAISILLPSKPHVSDTKRLISVRATPEHLNGPRKPPTPAHFDTAVVIEDEEVYEEGQIRGIILMSYIF
jgi:hypothetical protein